MSKPDSITKSEHGPNAVVELEYSAFSSVKLLIQYYVRVDKRGNGNYCTDIKPVLGAD